MSSMNQNAAVVDKNESGMVDCAELPFDHESDHFVSCNQPNDQAKKDDVVIDLIAMIENIEEDRLSPCCIYRVPHVIRELKQEAYTPKAVSIGPFHYGNVRLQNMEENKHIFFKRFIQGAKTSLDNLVNFAKISEPKVRACYSENVKLSEKELVKVILVDGGFIIELFRSFLMNDCFGGNGELSKPWLEDLVMQDLVLLENQLPFFFLEELYNVAFLLDFRGDDIPSFRKLTYCYFTYYNIQKLEPNSDETIKHFTDLLRLFHLPRMIAPRKQFGKEGSVLQYSVSELDEAGLKFKTSTSKCLLDLKFSGYVLEIPLVMVDDRFETLFSNLIALEQCHYPFDSDITDYALIMNRLINTNKDVKVLIHKGIICNYLADSVDVVKVFNDFPKNNIRLNFNSVYLDICQHLNVFYEDPWHKTRRDYWRTPLKKTVSISGIVILILTVVQTICSVLQVRPMGVKGI